MELLADLLVLACAAYFAAVGVAALARPAWLVGRWGLRLEGDAARSHVRAGYGGLGLAAAALLVWTATASGRGELWVPSVLAVLCFGMAVARLLANLLDRPRGGAASWRPLLVDLALTAALFGSHTLR